MRECLPAPAVNGRTCSRISCGLLSSTARLTLTAPAKLAAVLAGAFRALPLLNTPSRAMQSTRSKFVQSCRFHARVPCLINLEVPYPFIPANTPLGHCPSPLEQWPPQLANRDHPSSRSTVTQRISPPPAPPVLVYGVPVAKWLGNPFRVRELRRWGVAGGGVRRGRASRLEHCFLSLGQRCKSAGYGPPELAGAPKC